MTILLKDNPPIEKAHQRYVDFTSDRQARLAYEERWKSKLDQASQLDYAKREGLATGLAEGEVKGKMEGKVEGKREAARNFKALGISPQQIAQATGLSLDEVDRL